MKNTYVYVSRYKSEEKIGGISTYLLNEGSGELKSIDKDVLLNDPSYLNINKKERVLYTTIKEENKGENGKIASFSICEDGKAKYVNSVDSKGASPVYITIKRNNSHIGVANYRGGSISLFPVINKEIKEPISVDISSGSGYLKERQDKPYPHFTAFSPDEKYMLTVYLGLDEVKVHKVNEVSGALSEVCELRLELEKGCGPRHLTFSNDGKYLYILTELSSEVFVYETNGFDEPFTRIQMLSTVPCDFEGENYPAAIYVAKDNRYLYLSNRGHNSIATYKVNNDGTLENLGYTCTNGDFPRDFMITEDGSLMVVCNQKSGNISTFSVDKESGRVRFTGNTYDAPGAISVDMLSI